MTMQMRRRRALNPNRWACNRRQYYLLEADTLLASWSSLPYETNYVVASCSSNFLFHTTEVGPEQLHLTLPNLLSNDNILSSRVFPRFDLVTYGM